MSNNPFVPPAAGGLPLAALDSATEGANALDAWAADPHGRNFLAHALVQLARDGWLRPEAGEGFEPVRERDDVPEPQDPAVLPAVPVPPTTHAGDRAAVLRGAADALHERGKPVCVEEDGDCCWFDAVRELRRMADEAQQRGAAMNSRKPTNLVNVDFWADRIAAVIKLAEHYGMTMQITGGELVVSRRVSEAFTASAEVRWQPPTAEAQQQPDTETREETGTALARYIADRPMSEIQAAIRILGWPPLRFELVDVEQPVPGPGRVADEGADRG